MSAVARRYAKAAVDAAFDAGSQKAVDALYEGVRNFRDAYKESEELRELVLNPVLAGARDEALAALAKKLGMNEMALSLVKLLVINERIDVLDEVVNQVDILSDERAERLHAEVVSAIPLSEPQERRIKKALEGRYEKPVDLTVEIEPEILGGLVVRIGDKTIDSSLKRQLELVREQLLS